MLDEQQPQFLEIGEGGKRRPIAYLWSPGYEHKIQLLWLSGFRSDMGSTKATAIAEWAAAHWHPMLRFDYSGHGLSGGSLVEATIGDWLAETVAMWDSMGEAPRIVIGSSMGGWLALLLARHLVKEKQEGKLAGLVLIAPAWDMTEALMWRKFPHKIRREMETKRVAYLPSAYGEPYPVTKTLIEEGRSHLLERLAFDPGCPVRVLQGMRDDDVPWQHAIALTDLLQADDVGLNLIKDGDHRLSRPEDLRRLTATIALLIEQVS